MKKQVIKFLVLFLLLTFVFSLVSCDHSRENFDIIQAEFAKYEAQNEIAVIDHETVHWNDASLDLRTLIDADDNTHINGVMLINCRLYFLAVDYNFSMQKLAKKSASVLIYRCDMNGENLEVIFEKNDLTNVFTTDFNNVFYIRYKDEFEECIISYHPISQTQTILANGNSNTIQDFIEPLPTKYSVEITEEAFLIVEKETQEQHIIDATFLQNTEYFDALRQFKYIPYEYSHTPHDYDKINIVYRVEIDRFYELPKGFTFVIFEYDCRMQELTLQSTVFSVDEDALFVRNVIIN